MSPRPWLPDAEPGSGFGIDNLPLGVFVPHGGDIARVGMRVGDLVIDLAEAARRLAPEKVALFARPSLNAFLAAGPGIWRETRRHVTGWLLDEVHRPALESSLLALGEVDMRLPMEVGDYVDFYASEHHAANVGKIFRPDGDALPGNWRHLPIGYHGRSGTVVVSGTPVNRPAGLARRPGTGDAPCFGPSEQLDIEAEVGFLVGTSSALGTAVALDDFPDVVFGACVVNDWSARDIQAFEYVPLGPFLGKSFATSVSPWVVPLDALRDARVDPPARTVPLAPYLEDRDRPWGLDIELEVRLNGTVVTRPRLADMYWTAAQQLAHMTANGASVRTGDLYASGTVSGAERGTWGSLLEITWSGRDPIVLDDGSTRGFLQDGDEVVISASAPSSAGRISFGEVSGRIQSSRAGLPDTPARLR